MTVSVNDAMTSFTGDGSTITFNYDFPCDDDAFIKVYVDNELIDAEDYSINLATKVVTFDVAPANASAGTIIRRTAVDQAVDYSTYSNSVNLTAIAAQLDKLTMAAQEYQRELDRTVKVAFGSTGSMFPVPAASYYIGWNSAGTALENKVIGTLGDVEVSLDETLSAVGDLVVASVATIKAHLIAGYQPLDGELTAIAALTTTAYGRAFLELADAAAGKTALGLTAAALLDTEDQVLTGGARVTSKNLGTVSSGTLTPDPGDRQLQYYTNGGAHTLAPGTNTGSYLLDITNNGSAGAITTSGWTKVVGDAFTTTNGHKFRCSCSVGNGGSLLIIQALQ